MGALCHPPLCLRPYAPMLQHHTMSVSSSSYCEVLLSAISCDGSDSDCETDYLRPRKAAKQAPQSRVRTRQRAIEQVNAARKHDDAKMQTCYQHVAVDLNSSAVQSDSNGNLYYE